MMTTPDQVAIRAVFVYPNKDARALPPTHRLLNDLGHDVTTTSSLDEALPLLEDGPIDLLILEEDSSSVRPGEVSFKQHVLNVLDTLRADQQPRDVAIFADRPDESLPSLRRSSDGPKVHMLFKPLHVHGLLHVLRHLESHMA